MLAMFCDPARAMHAAKVALSPLGAPLPSSAAASTLALAARTDRAWLEKPCRDDCAWAASKMPNASTRLAAR